jgi:hypothetical protein
VKGYKAQARDNTRSSYVLAPVRAFALPRCCEQTTEQADIMVISKTLSTRCGYHNYQTGGSWNVSPCEFVARGFKAWAVPVYKASCALRAPLIVLGCKLMVVVYVSMLHACWSPLQSDEKRPVHVTMENELSIRALLAFFVMRVWLYAS